MYRILLFAALVASVCGLILISTRGSQSSPLPQPPEVRAHHQELSLTLHAVADSDGRDSFAFNGHRSASVAGPGCLTLHSSFPLPSARNSKICSSGEPTNLSACSLNHDSASAG